MMVVTGLSTVVLALITQTLLAEQTKLAAIPERAKYWPKEWTRHYSIGPIRVIVGLKKPLGVGLRTVDQRCVVTGIAQNGIADKVTIAPASLIMPELYGIQLYACHPCFRVGSNKET